MLEGDQPHAVDVTLPASAAIITASLAVVTYVRDDGSLGYAISCRGEQPKLHYLGMATAAQQQIDKWGDENP